MSRARSAFSARTVLAMLLVGALAFLLMLYAIGKGWTGDDAGAGGAHAASNGLNGFTGLVALLEATGSQVEVSRNRAQLDDIALVILTPQLIGDADAIGEAILERQRTGDGPTLLILPKWHAMPFPEGAEAESVDGTPVEPAPGWVTLAAADSPEWFGELDMARGGALAVGKTRGWSGLERRGSLPDANQAQALVDQPNLVIEPLVTDSEGDLLAGVLQRTSDYDDYVPYPVVVVFEPDLLNNYGLADRGRAELALALIDTAVEGDTDLPIVFDMTLAGLGASENLLTLAFRPPFLAATLCLLLAALVIGWRAFNRFGPPVAEVPAMARGKRQLARNGAALVARTRRFHLLKSPYEALVGRRVAARLGLRVADTDAREAAIDRVLAARGNAGPSFSRLAADLRDADHPRDIIRAATALRTFERTLHS
ncbi:DUF4350 domain-containing protein [Erythrobacter arachoides]|uniref:DUF4350 domain-containing protein n=1 Tax=Aurantiacibacter arachoides TaxID=1850444 RepID=A0A844ZWZ5_9SPHN|nr:DUF4350 domain-containing protein [Aurantiacibacter arachoides]MXO92258.1 DUF4350 domain-containing protein [Aurantiacibacter arachoides]GGD58474.1 hypothetical protein GCM10011411_18320 [Aurantiacibacter arachoides]